MENRLIKAIKSRRSIYSISNVSTIPDSSIEELVRIAVMYTPSPYNMQSGRAVLLYGEHHHKLWNGIVLETLRKITSEDKFIKATKKIAGFDAGYATVMFFDATEVTKEFENKYPKYAEKIASWAHHSIGMMQFALWTMLEDSGFGASLQHYNPIIDDEVKDQWDLPASWQLIAQMPFGKPVAMPEDKEFDDINKRLKIFK